MADAGWQSFTVGDLTITAISDGAITGARAKWFDGVDPAQWLPAVGIDDPQTPLPVNFGIFLVTGDGHTTLVDSGFGPSARGRAGFVGGGMMLDHLGELGVRPEDVDRIVQTHLHPDHCGWLLGEDAQTVTFPRAEVYAHDLELRYWESEEVQGQPFNGRMAPDVRHRIERIRLAGLLRPFVGDLVLSPTMSVLWTPGHTPGHCCVLVTSRGEHALLVGDLAHHPVHLEHHDWLQDVNIGREESIRSRGRICDLAVATDALVTGPHLPVLTLGRLRRTPGGYSFEPVASDGSGSPADSSKPRL